VGCYVGDYAIPDHYYGYYKIIGSSFIKHNPSLPGGGGTNQARPSSAFISEFVESSPTLESLSSTSAPFT
jgi:hypothetical protein